jgi:hypothetical protein
MNSESGLLAIERPEAKAVDPCFQVKLTRWYHRR